MEETRLQYYITNAKQIKKKEFIRQPTQKARLGIRARVFTLRVVARRSALCPIRKNSHSQKKYVVQHIKKFAQFKKKQYLCSVKTRGYINIVLLIIAIILAIMVLHRALIHNIVQEISQMCI